MSGLAWVLAVLSVPGLAWAHAFPDHSEPRVGATVSSPPSEVRIWFDGQLEPVFSTIRVENSQGQRVDGGDGHVDVQDNRILEARLAPLPPGKYRVYWSVVARDGHRTEGDFSLKIK